MLQVLLSRSDAQPDVADMERVPPTGSWEGYWWCHLGAAGLVEAPLLLEFVRAKLARARLRSVQTAHAAGTVVCCACLSDRHDSDRHKTKSFLPHCFTAATSCVNTGHSPGEPECVKEVRNEVADRKPPQVVAEGCYPAPEAHHAAKVRPKWTDAGTVKSVLAKDNPDSLGILKALVRRGRTDKLQTCDR